MPASWKNRCSTRSNSLFRDAVFVPDAALANIEVLTKDASALQVGITTVTYDPIPGGFKNLAYQIKNNSERRIVAIEIFIEVSDGVNVSRSPQYIDAWAKEGAGLLPFDSEPGPEGLWMVSNGGGVRSIELSIGAVVFTDGTTLGEDAADFRKFLTSEHQKLLTRAVSISKVLNSKGISAARLMIEEPAMSISERHANLLLEAALERGGPRAMQAEVARLQSLQP